ncbi:MAG: prolipoprotein diacylglyceryl transferase, partial [Eubacteriales bacterium]|nr:prolipoprotein diacylglyceryl transferase [Eubacteriales bacterium]
MMQNPDRICFSIGPVNVYWYGVLMATGIVVAILLAMQEAKRKKLYADAIIDACLIMIPMGV